MKMKRLLIWLLVFALCFALTACGEENASATESNRQATESVIQDTATPLLYRVTDESGNVAWLFGAIHVGRADYFPLPDYVQSAFEKAELLAVEVEIVAFEKDIGHQMTALTPLVYTDGTTIKDHIPQELYDKAVEIFAEYDSYATALDYYCPAFWSSMIDSLMITELGGDVNFGIDRNMINEAYQTGKEIVEIESAEFQYQMMADFDEDVQRMLLASSVEAYENKEETASELKEMMDLWASGDESAFSQYLNETDETMTAEEKQAYERYNQAMITARNLAMADYAEAALASGKEVFICVGAAHIVGEGAMAELLAQRGYTVERIVTE